MHHSNGIAAFTLAFLVAFFSTEPALAQRRVCTNAEARLALDEAVTLRSWDGLYRSYRKFGQCDDGAIAEGYSESVARVLSDHWNSLPRLAELASVNVAFRGFVLGHVDATLNTDDLERIKKRATTLCPPNLQTTCKDLAKQADHALNEP